MDSAVEPRLPPSAASLNERYTLAGRPSRAGGHPARRQTMSRLTLSNIQLRSNLLSEDYPREMGRVTVFELKDIRRRNPLLRPPEAMTNAQREQWTRHLF